MRSYRSQWRTIIKNLSSRLWNKGYVLSAVLPSLLLLILFYAVYVVEIHNESIQNRLLPRMDRFSLIEMEVLKLTIDAFRSFDPQNFSIEINGVDIDVTFENEIAMIVYGDPENITATLQFDMVFGYVTSYRLNRISDSD